MEGIPPLRSNLGEADDIQWFGKFPESVHISNLKTRVRGLVKMKYFTFCNPYLTLMAPFSTGDKVRNLRNSNSGTSGRWGFPLSP
jgi:hypothetical protein